MASPAFTGTPTGITAAHLEAGVLPSDVTGGSGLTALGTVTAGNLSNTAIVYPAGHILQTIIDTDTGTSRLTTTASAWEDMTGLSCAITSRQANSNFLITAHSGMTLSGGDSARLQVDIKRVITGGATTEALSSIAASGTNNYVLIHRRDDQWESETSSYLDVLSESAGTTITYSLVWWSGGGGTVYWLHESSLSSLMVQEIAV